VPFSTNPFSRITRVGKCGNSVGPNFDARLSLQNEPTTYNSKHTAVANITADPVKQISASPSKLNAVIDTTANITEKQCKPDAANNTAADASEKCHDAGFRFKSDVVAESAVTSASVNSTIFAKLISIVLQHLKEETYCFLRQAYVLFFVVFRDKRG